MIVSIYNQNTNEQTFLDTPRLAFVKRFGERYYSIYEGELRQEFGVQSGDLIEVLENGKRIAFWGF